MRAVKSSLIVHFSLLFFSMVFTNNAIAKIDGEALYQKHCSSCHQTDGKGGLGMPFKKSNFRYLSDNYLFKTIRLGRPGRVMPAFNKLSDGQVTAIVNYLRARSGTPSPAESTITVKGNAANGKKLFDKNCLQCHGKQGQGLGKGTGKSFSRKRQFEVIPPAIGNEGFLASASDTMLRQFIANGRQDSIMPIFTKQGFSGQDIDDVIVYLRTLPIENTVPTDEEVLPNPAIIVDSPDDFETTVDNLKQALSGYNFRIFPDRFIEQGLFPDWEVNKKQVTLRYCNFNNLYDMLKIDPRLGIGLPCRITVIEGADGKVQIVAMNMALIARLFNNKQLKQYAQEMNNVQLEIIEEVTF